ncbi:unnamed protein product [Soboliphyme baturini]|uniref:HECT domain-containing protein n=1 Tax=Soboliphyme baturini TaxID=241478 RepID=A0A183IDU9_9BILA|nr:unnamed protein product [Soboliphyme baturini]
MSATDEMKAESSGLYSMFKNKAVSFAVKRRVGKAILCRPMSYPIPPLYSQSAVFHCFCAILCDWKKNEVSEAEVAELWTALVEFQHTSSECCRVFIVGKHLFVKATLNCLSRAKQTLDVDSTADAVPYLLPLGNCLNFVLSRQELNCVLKSNTDLLFDFLCQLVEVVTKLQPRVHRMLFPLYLRICTGSMQDFLLLKVFWGYRKQLFSQFCKKMLCNCVNLYGKLCNEGATAAAVQIQTRAQALVEAQAEAETQSSDGDDCSELAESVLQFVTSVLLHTSRPEDFVVYFQRRDSNLENIYVKALFQAMIDMSASLAQASPFMRFFPRFLSLCKPFFNPILSIDPLLLMKFSKFAIDTATSAASATVVSNDGGSSVGMPVAFLADVFRVIREQGFFTVVEDKEGAFLSWMASLKSELDKNMGSDLRSICDFLNSLLFIHPALVMDNCETLIFAVHRHMGERCHEHAVSTEDGQQLLTNLIVMHGKVRQISTLIRIYIGQILNNDHFALYNFEVTAFATTCVFLPYEELEATLSYICTSFRTVLRYRSDLSHKAVYLALLLAAMSKESFCFSTVEIVDVIWRDVFKLASKIRKKCKSDDSWLVPLHLIYRTLLYSLLASCDSLHHNSRYAGLQQALKGHGGREVVPAFLDFAETHSCSDSSLCASVCPLRDTLHFLMNFGDVVLLALKQEDQFRAYAFVCREAFEHGNEFFVDFLRDTTTWEDRTDSSIGALMSSLFVFCAGCVRKVFESHLEGGRGLKLIEAAARLCIAETSAADDRAHLNQVFDQIGSLSSSSDYVSDRPIRDSGDLATVLVVLETLVVIPFEYFAVRQRTVFLTFSAALLHVLCSGVVGRDVSDILMKSVRLCCTLVMSLLEQPDTCTGLQEPVDVLVSLTRSLFRCVALSRNDWLLDAARCIVGRCVLVMPLQCQFAIFQPSLTFLTDNDDDFPDDDSDDELLLDTLYQISCLKEARQVTALPDDMLSTLDSILCHRHDGWQREPTSTNLFFRCFLPCVDFWCLLSAEAPYACTQFQDDLCREYIRRMPDVSLDLFVKSVRHSAEFFFYPANIEKYGDLFLDAYCQGPKQLDLDSFTVDSDDIQLMTMLISQFSEEHVKMLFSDSDEDNLGWKVYVTFLTVKALPAAKKQELVSSVQTNYIACLIQQFFSNLPMVEMLHNEEAHCSLFILRLATALVRDKSLGLRKKQIVLTALNLAADVPFDGEYDDEFCPRFQAELPVSVLGLQSTRASNKLLGNAGQKLTTFTGLDGTLHDNVRSYLLPCRN